jgi:hypothetical protein
MIKKSKCLGTLCKSMLQKCLCVCLPAKCELPPDPFAAAVGDRLVPALHPEGRVTVEAPQPVPERPHAERNPELVLSGGKILFRIFFPKLESSF